MGEPPRISRCYTVARRVYARCTTVIKFNINFANSELTAKLLIGIKLSAGYRARGALASSRSRFVPGRLRGFQSRSAAICGLDPTPLRK